MSIWNGRRIASVTRWGRRGDKRDGIDLKGKWTDGRSAVWPCNGIQPFRQQMWRRRAWTAPSTPTSSTWVSPPWHRLMLERRSRNTRAGTYWTSAGLGQLLADLPLHLADLPLHRRWEILVTTDTFLSSLMAGEEAMTVYARPGADVERPSVWRSRRVSRSLPMPTRVRVAGFHRHHQCGDVRWRHRWRARAGPNDAGVVTSGRRRHREWRRRPESCCAQHEL